MASISLTIEELLTKHGLSKDIFGIFTKNKVTMDQLRELDGNDLKELGVVAFGDRKRLRKATQEAKEIDNVCYIIYCHAL